MYENERKEKDHNNWYQGCVLGLVRAILGLVRATGTSDFLCQHMRWIQACRDRSSSCAGELERLDLLAPASPATCYFPDANRVHRAKSAGSSPIANRRLSSCWITTNIY